jgi:two-component system alkaline phosphatase synthesis response regulator PhoP
VEEEAAETFGAPGEKTILVADDDESIRDLLTMCLQAEGFKLVLAVDGNDAIAKLERSTPDLIVTDLMMPGLGGFEFMRGLAAAGAGRLPIVVITGSIMDASTVALLKQEGNVVDFFNKPVKMPKFIATIHRALRTAPVAR